MNISTNFLLYNIFSNEKKATKQRFHNKKCLCFGKYAQTLGTYLLINSSFALKHLLCMLPRSLYIGSSGTLFSLSVSISRTHSSSVASLFFIICRGEYRKRQIGSFTFMIPFHCVHLRKLCLFSWFYAGTNRGEREIEERYEKNKPARQIEVK